MKKTCLLLSAMLFSVLAVSCSTSESPVLNECAIHHDDEFGGAYIDISIDDFNKLGFKFGDSLDLKFSNNVVYTDIGYYSGYYVPAGQELVVGYPGYDYIKFCINYGDDVYKTNLFDKNTKVTITVNEAQKYKDIEEILSISYSNDIKDYTDEKEFANFRAINVGNLKENLIYRGASPIDNRRKRASVVDDLLEKNEIAYVLDLADGRTTVDGFYAKEDFDSPYFKSLDEKGDVALLSMAAAFKADDFSLKMKSLFLSMIQHDGKYYIHCLEGKDRTGFVCMVIEALCGATYEELVDDYFVTYHNYYGVEKGSKKYEVIKELHIDEMIKYVFSFEETTTLFGANYHSKANNYLLSIGLTQKQIDQVQAKLSK